MHSLCSVQAMGVTNFINPKDEEKPVYQVGILCPLILQKKISSIYTCILTTDISNKTNKLTFINKKNTF